MSKNKQLISVIMPVYNSADYLAESVESILNQSYGDFELIILDDGSTDRSWEIIQESASKDSRITANQNVRNMGIFYTRNLGLDLSKGRYIAVMDSDDIATSDRFEKQVAYLDSHPEVDVLGGQIIKFGDTTQSGKKTSYPLTPGGLRLGLILGCQLAHSTVMMRNHLFSVEGFRYRDYKVAQDYDLWTRLATGHKIANLPDVLVKYRIHQASISRTKEQIQKEETIRIIQDYVKRLSGDELSEALIRGLIITKDIRSVESALSLSKFLLEIEKFTKKWDVDPQEKSEISHQAAYKLHSICKHFNYHPRLFRVLLAAGLLQSKSRWQGRFEVRKAVL